MHPATARLRGCIALVALVAYRGSDAQTTRALTTTTTTVWTTTTSTATCWNIVTTLTSHQKNVTDTYYNREMDEINKQY